MKEQKKLERLEAKEYIEFAGIEVQRHLFNTYPLHWHNYFEIELVVNGNGQYIHNGTSRKIEKRDAYLLTPTDFHEILADPHIELINVSFDETVLTEKMRAVLFSEKFVKSISFSEEDYECFVSASNLLKRECEIGGSCSVELLEYLLNLFIRNNNGYDTNLEENVVNEGHLTGITKAIIYMEIHFREKITLDDISAFSGYNSSYFSELFKRVMGETYIERLKTLRINYAKMLLAKGFSVSEACFNSGFGSLSNFLSAFKKQCKISPSEYKKTKEKSNKFKRIDE